MKKSMEKEISTVTIPLSTYNRLVQNEATLKEILGDKDKFITAYNDFSFVSVDRDSFIKKLVEEIADKDKRYIELRQKIACVTGWRSKRFRQKTLGYYY